MSRSSASNSASVICVGTIVTDEAASPRHQAAHTRGSSAQKKATSTTCATQVELIPDIQTDFGCHSPAGPATFL